MINTVYSMVNSSIVIATTLVFAEKIDHAFSNVFHVFTLRNHVTKYKNMREWIFELLRNCDRRDDKIALYS